MHLPFASAKWQSLWRMHRIHHSVVIPSGVRLNVVVTSVVAPSVVMLNVVVPFAILLQRNGKAAAFAYHSPFAIRWSEWQDIAFATGECVTFARLCHWPVHAFACGECGVFANLLKRIGKWHRANDRRRLGFADFNAKANGKCLHIQIGKESKWHWNWP